MLYPRRLFIENDSRVMSIRTFWKKGITKQMSKKAKGDKSDQSEICLFLKRVLRKACVLISVRLDMRALG